MNIFPKSLYAMCRVLHLLNSNGELINLAGPDLLSLSSSRWRGAPDTEVFSKLTKLTRLELKDYVWASFNLGWLRDLAVEELILINCPELSSQIFCPGALTALRKLHLEEAAEDLPSKSAQTYRAQQLAALPRLRQVSGNGILFTDEMLSAFAGWLESDFTEQTIECHTNKSHVRLTVFIKRGV